MAEQQNTPDPLVLARSVIAGNRTQIEPLLPILHEIQDALGCVPPEVETLIGKVTAENSGGLLRSLGIAVAG